MAQKSLHYYLLDQVRHDLLMMLEKTCSDADDDKLCSFLFKNYRKTSDGKQHGLRLTAFGINLLARHFNYYKLSHQLPIVTHLTYLQLEQKMLWPYYLTSYEIFLFSDTDATWFALHGGDLMDYLESQ
jgi:hypothetical protein